MNATFGRYRLLERLGQGGMAEVFKAKSYGVEGFEKVVVIKRILPDLARSKEFVDMFIHEAKLAVRLSHANIVQVFDLGLAGPGGPESSPSGDPRPPSYYMAMEYVHGFDLATVLAQSRRQQRPLPIDMCVYVAAEVAKGLDHAHRRRDEQLKPLGIVHRDVSPQNVLLSLEGEVKVTDFGIAKARGALESGAAEDTQTRKLQGKFGYMSPEQARGDSVDARSDLFSLGTVLYECIAGVNPFSAPTTFETLRRVQACEFPPVELLRPDCPSELVAIVKNALAKDPQARYADAGRMYEALVAFLYTQGRRYNANDLAEFMASFRSADEASAPASQLADASLEEGGHGTNEKTPVEIPSARPPASSMAANRVETGVRVVERAAGMGERREVSALTIELPDREQTQLGDRAVQIVTRYGGRVAKREPEQITALFGLGEPDGRDTEVATRCALVALRALDGPRRPSAGLHTARIHVSADGEPTEDERLAALLSTARDLARVREGACAVSAPAMRQIRAMFLLEPITDLEQTAGGSAASIVKDVRGAAEAFGRFVGRKEELRKIGEVLATATKRAARVLTVRGDHGTGKTRLLVEVERRLRKGGYNVGWYMATCPPRGRELPLSGIIAMLQMLCGVAEGDAPERVGEVQPRLRALGMNDEEVAATLSVLGANVPTPAGNMKSMLRNAFSRMVASLCEDRPTTFAWDAAHCMDADSYAILESAFQRLVHVRVVFVLAARAGFSHPLEKLVAHASLDLTDLNGEDMARLVAMRLAVERAPDELVQFVRDRAGGHPLFIEEVIKGLVDARAVTIADKRVVTMKLVGQDLALPKTLRGLVAARVSRLAPEDRAIVQAAAVLGDPFTTPVLAQMTGAAMSQLEKTVATLRERELLVHTGPSELRFTSPIVREVVVDAMPPQALREMHGVAGLSLETVLGDGAFEHASRIATHFYEAGNREHAATYFARSGERRLEGRQLEAAARDYARAIELCDLSTRDPKELAAWLRGLSSAVRLVRSLPEAAEMCERIVARMDEAGDVALQVGARVDAGRILGALHQFEAASQYFAAAEKRAAGNELLVKTALVAGAELSGRQGDFNRSLEILEKLQKLATVGGDKQEEHKILVSLAQAHAAIGDRRDATSYLQKAEQLLPADPTAVCERLKLLALIEYFARDNRAAAAACEKAVDMARELGLGYEVAVNLHNLGDILVRLEDFARAYGAVQQSLALCDESGFERLSSHNRMFLAFLDAVRGDADADKRLIQGIRYAEANDFTWDVIGGRLLLAQLLQRRGEVAAARAEFERLREIARSAGNRLVADDCDAGLATLSAEGDRAAGSST